MRIRPHTIAVLFAVGAVFLNCALPQVAIAAHHPERAKVDLVDHGSRHGAETHGDHEFVAHDHAGRGGADHSKLCCASTCTVSAYIAATPAVLVPTGATARIANLLEDMLRAFNAAAIDPPPRFI